MHVNYSLSRKFFNNEMIVECNEKMLGNLLLYIFMKEFIRLMKILSMTDFPFCGR